MVVAQQWVLTPLSGRAGEGADPAALALYRRVRAFAPGRAQARARPGGPSPPPRLARVGPGVRPAEETHGVLTARFDCAIVAVHHLVWVTD